MASDLDEAKQRLLEKLGSNYGVYIQLLGKWFRGMISKEEFDKTAKRLIEQNFVLEHNKFWLAFFHHCANSASSSIQDPNYSMCDGIGQHYNQTPNEQPIDGGQSQSPDLKLLLEKADDPRNANRFLNFRYLPSKIITHMKIFVIAWEMGLDSVNDHVSLYVNLALQHFLKNILAEVISTKTSYRLRENRFKYALGVKSMNPYLNNSLKVYNSYFEYDPYQIESNKMNCSLVDTYAYNDSLFPSRLYEAQALYEFACSTTSVISSQSNMKRLKLDEIFLTQDDASKNEEPLYKPTINGVVDDTDAYIKIDSSGTDIHLDATDNLRISDKGSPSYSGKKLTLFHLLLTLMSNRTIIPSQSLYSINIEKILMKLSC